MKEFAEVLLEGFTVFILVYFIALNAYYLFTGILAIFEMRRHVRSLHAIGTGELLEIVEAPPITVIVPAFNEEQTCVATIRSLLSLDYPRLEVLFVNDGSTDGTWARMKEAFSLRREARFPLESLRTEAIRGLYRGSEPRLRAIDKDRGGKSDALNAGLNFCRSPLYCSVDADTLLEPKALQSVVRPFLLDERIVAVGAIIRIANGCEFSGGRPVRLGLPKSLIGKLQVVEYLRAFLSGRIGLASINASLLISGAFGIFRRADAVAAGGYSTKTVAEDMELVVRIQERLRDSGREYRIAYMTDPVAWTECPEKLRGLLRQRIRWHQGLIESMGMHRKLLFNSRYGTLGTIGFPLFYFFEMLGPAFETCGYIFMFFSIAAGTASLTEVLAFFTLAFLLGAVISLLSVILEERCTQRYPSFHDLLELIVISLIENLGFRQMLAVVKTVGTLVPGKRSGAKWVRSEKAVA